MSEPLTDPMGMTEEKREPHDPARLFDPADVPPHVEQHVILVKAELREAADRVYTLMMPCRERSLALTKLEEASYFAHAGLVREGIETDADGGFVEIDRRRAVRKQVEGMIDRAMKLSEVYLTGNRENARELLTKLVEEA